jgi:hypothetical protein
MPDLHSFLKHNARQIWRVSCLALLGTSSLLVGSCADVSIPGARNLNVPGPAVAEERDEAVNEVPDSVIYLPLGSDVLVPSAVAGTTLPTEEVGPFELRSETLAGALQLILADYEIPMAFESDEGLTRTITVTNLKGPLNRVVSKVCSLADLYCSFEDGVLVIKETQLFTVTIPPVGGDTDLLTSLSAGIDALTGGTSITEDGTRTLIYEATSRSAPLAERYFQRLRANTALIVYEINIWEVSLNSDNATGIDWQNLEVFGKFATGINIPGGAPNVTNPISIGLPTTNGPVTFDSNDVVEFLSTHGAVKTISQPQITMLSGSEAFLRAAETRNYVSSLSRTIEGDQTTVSTQTDSVDTGFSLTISSAWDKSTVYGGFEIELQEFRGFTTFGGGTENEIQLPTTTERELTTQIRIRPGDSLLIAGLVRETDEYTSSGPGFEAPIFPTSRSSDVANSELVFLLKPRVIVFTEEEGRRPVDRNADREYVAPSDEFPAGSIPEDLLNPQL